MKARRFPALSRPRSTTGIMTKRRRINSPPHPFTPHPPPYTPLMAKLSPKLATTTSLRFKVQRSLAADIAGEGVWETLPLPRSEIFLPLTLPTGQTFRWRRTAPSRFTGVIGRHLLSLQHVDGDPSGRVAFLLHNPGGSTASSARVALYDYLNLNISLAELWRGFSDADARFAEIASGLDGGARVLRQDPVECVFQFLCSSNNNIARIEKMVGVLSSFGEYLGTVDEFDFHLFPSLEQLADVSEEQLREAGFGYRAKYIVDAVKVLQGKPGGGAAWLLSLRGLELHEVLNNLCTLPGVGPKVAACIALFSLDQHHAIPVDTHVWKIATRYLMPELAGKRLTPKLCSHVSEAFVARFGKYAGWAQNVLFIGELSTQKAAVATLGGTKPGKVKRLVKKKKVVPKLSDEIG